MVSTIKNGTGYIVTAVVWWQVTGGYMSESLNYSFIQLICLNTGMN